MSKKISFRASKCFFTGKETNSSEHVIPRWLQQRFDLAEQSLVIPNGTTLKYRLHQVPADRIANNKFGEIEDRISRGVFLPDEVYLWALKIHIGCIYRDASLRMDISDPTSESVLDVSDFQQEVWFFQKLFANMMSGGKTIPSPFGSVFVVDSLYPRAAFDFMHCLVTGTVGVNIGDKFILVFLWDQGAAMSSNLLEIWQEWHVKRTQALKGGDDYEAHAYMAHHVWACEGAYGAYRRRRPFRFILAPNVVALVPQMFGPEQKQFNQIEYQQICRNFGLDLLHSGGPTDNRYSQLFNVQFRKSSKRYNNGGGGVDGNI